MDELLSITEKMYDLLSDREFEFDSWNEVASCLSCGASEKGSKGPPQHKDNCQWKLAIADFERWKESFSERQTM